VAKQWMDLDGIWHACVTKPCPTCGQPIEGDTEADWGAMLGWHRALDKCPDEQGKPRSLDREPS
jgi:hypothetical protein